MDAVHKHAAIEEWDCIAKSPQPSELRLKTRQLERALGAFDLFVLHDQPGDLDDVCPGPKLLVEYGCIANSVRLRGCLMTLPLPFGSAMESFPIAQCVKRL